MLIQTTKKLLLVYHRVQYSVHYCFWYMWTISTNSSKLFQFILFADDTTLLTKKGINNSLINRELCKISIRFKVNKLSLNVPRSKCILFHQPQKTIIAPGIIIDGNKIDCVNNFNFLGLIINKHLNWNNHIDHISLKMSNWDIDKTKTHYTNRCSTFTLQFPCIATYNYSLLVWGHNPFRITKLKKKMSPNHNV